MNDTSSMPEAGQAARRLPRWVLWVALLAALLHMAPYWLEQSSTPPGWSFTGNTTISPDLMQYRVWMRQAPDEGVVVSNKLTAEENKPYLPVLFYYGLGTASNWTGMRPEALYAYAGAPLAFALVILLFVAVRTFLGGARAVKWTFFVILLGGGLGGYIRLAGEIPSQWLPSLFRRLILRPVDVAPVLDDYRHHYIFRVLFDTHFLLIWLLATLSVLLLYWCLRRPTRIGAAATSAMFALTTLLHPYSGVTLLAIAAAVALICRRDMPGRRDSWLGPAAGIAGGLFVLIWLWQLQRSSGLPYPNWKEMPLPVITLVLGYPVAVLWLSRGFSRYWQERDIKRSFLVAWVVGCLAVVLAWPFNPYPSRGTMTLQIGLYLLAGSVYFARRTSVPRWEALLIIFLLGATPAWRLFQVGRDYGFRPDAPHVWLSRDHSEVVQRLRESGTGEDVLLASPREELWLAPEYPGRHYVAHFFLTADYDRKLRELEAFFQASPEEQVRFLVERDVRFLFVSAHGGRHRVLDLSVRQDPESFRDLPGLDPIVETTIGTLFEFGPPDEAAPLPAEHR